MATAAATTEASPSQLNYVNPLTLESQIFVNSLEKYGPSFNTIDMNLCSSLENVVIAINKFLDQTPKPISETKVTNPMEIAKSFRNLYECKQCMETLYNPKNATRHFIQHQKYLKNTKVINTSTQKEETLPNSIKSLFTGDLQFIFTSSIMVGEKLKTLPDYDTIKKDLLSLIVPLFPKQDVKLHFFGSRMIGVAQPYADLDIFVAIGRNLYNSEDRASEMTIRILHLVKNSMLMSRAWRNLICLDQAIVPILRVSHRLTNIKCDIGFSNSLGVCNTSLRKYLFELQPIAKQMCIFLKKWLERSKLSTVSSYSMALMLITFLQIINILPSIESLQVDFQNTVRIGPWIGDFDEKNFEKLNLSRVEDTIINCKKYLKRFFEWCAKFDYSQYFMCPYFGRQIAISTVGAEMPERYTNYVKKSEAFKLCITPMVVQDPFQLNQNVTIRVCPEVLLALKNYFGQSAKALHLN